MNENEHETPTRYTRERLSLLWLRSKLYLPKTFDLSGYLEEIETNGTGILYDEGVKRQGEKRRVLYIPIEDLAMIQQRINRRLLAELDRHPNTFGFSGGRTLEVAERHSDMRSTLTCDFRDAFFQVTGGRVFSSLRRAGFGWYVSRAVSALCIVRIPREGYWQTFLPQGAPSSPRLFDLACHDLDRKLARVAERVGGVYSRYADNIFFSTHEEVFPPEIKKIVLAEIWTRGGFHVHKIRTLNHGRAFRMLGLNIRGGRVHNTRAFKRKLRGALHHLEYLLDSGTGFGVAEAEAHVNGLLGFAIPRTLEGSLGGQWKRCIDKLFGNF